MNFTKMTTKAVAGKWPRKMGDRLQKPVWQLAGLCPGLGSWLLTQRLRSWEKNRLPISVALAGSALGEHLLVRVPPDSLQERLSSVGYTADRKQTTHDFRSQFVFHGDVTHLLSPISQSNLDDEINQLFANGMMWRETQTYDSLLSRLHSQGAFRHNNVSLSSPKDIDRYFERYVRLAESIQQHGYKSRRELKQSHGKSMKRRCLIEFGEQEVGVAIGPDGEIWRFGGGYHRTAIARNLGLETMPVMIRLVHWDWLKLRGDNYNGWFAGFKGGGC